MFDTFDTNISNRFSYNINAVSGTLRKSHPKSKFCVREVDDAQYIFNVDNPHLTYRNEKEIVILQAMLTGENKILIEYVLKSDFEEV